MCSDPNRQEKKYTSKNHVPSESLVISFCCWVKANSQYSKFVIKLIKAIIQNNNNYYYFFISLKQLKINKHCHHGFWKQVWFVLICFFELIECCYRFNVFSKNQRVLRNNNFCSNQQFQQQKSWFLSLYL